jgi:hypothetical protein
MRFLATRAVRLLVLEVKCEYHLRISFVASMHKPFVGCVQISLQLELTDFRGETSSSGLFNVWKLLFCDREHCS